MRSTLRDDFRTSSWRQRGLLVATAMWIAYEWGFGNETLTPWLLVTVIDSTTGVQSMVATASVGFAFTTLQQVASGFTAAAGFSMFERTSAAAWRLLRSRLDRAPRPWGELSVPLRAMMVFTLGTTAVVLIETTATGEVGVGRHRRTIVGAAALCGLVVGAIGAVVAGAVWLGRTVPSLEPATSWLLAVLGNPLFWIGLLVAVMSVNSVRRRRDD